MKSKQRILPILFSFLAVIYLLNPLLSIATAGKSTSILSGKITVKKTGEGLPGVIIYLPDLKRGTTTDLSGSYTLEKLPIGKVTINISLIGYSAVVKIIDLSVQQLLNIELEETAKEINEIVVTGSSQAVEKKRTSIPILTVNRTTLLQTTSGNIIDALATQPGINQITTGAGISKPVIRGLGFNRVVIVNDGIRQEGQQWGDEHGVEIDEYSVDKIEVLKGPASLSYGSDAIAGVINMISAPTLQEGKIDGNAILNYQTNNGLIGTSINTRGNKHGFIWDVRLSNKLAHSYSNRYDGYVYNSGYREYTFSTITGLNKSWGYSHLHISNYHLQPGIIEGERDVFTGTFIKPVILNDSTSAFDVPTLSDYKSYQPEIPFQKVNHLKIVSNSSFIAGSGTLKTIFGFQQNSRKEYNDVFTPKQYQLYFLLNTLNYEARYVFPEKKEWNISAGINGMQQISSNKGTKYLIPEYHLFDIGSFVLARKTIGKADISGGFRYDRRNVTTASLYLNSDGQKVNNTSVSAQEKFSSGDFSFNGYSGSLGIAFQFSSTVYNKLNLSRGFRAPNMAELKSNGVHEGTSRYEIGNPLFKSEKSFQVDYVLGINSDHVLVEMDLFANRIDDFIYLNRVINTYGQDSIREGSNVFQFSSGNTEQQGGEITIDIHPHPLDWLHFMNSFSYVRSIQLNQSDSTKYLPSTPPAKFSSELRFDLKKVTKGIRNGYLKIDLDHFFDQNNIYSAYHTETSTPDYTLLNLGLGVDVFTKNKTICSFIFSISNLTDVAYQSHLSRLKYSDTNNATGRSGIYNMGRNFSFKLLVPLG